MFFDREPFRVDIAPTMIKVGELERPERYPEMLEAMKQRMISRERQHDYEDRFAIAHAYDKANEVSMYGDAGIAVN